MSCYFCQRDIKEINFRDVKTLDFFISAQGKIKPRKKTRLCAKHQNRLAEAIKRARFLALLPYSKK